jgi:hypothetical protein
VLALDGVERVDFEPTVANRPGTMQYFWVWGAGFDEVESALAADSAVGSANPVEHTEGGRLYRATWNAGVPEFLDAIRAGSGEFRVGSGTDEWTFELRFESNGNLGAFSTHCATAGLDAEVRRIRSLVGPREDGYGLTATQRTTLLAAEELGYFDEPRAVTLAELAGALDRSSGAVSGILRRGMATLIRNTLQATSDDDA